MLSFPNVAPTVRFSTTSTGNGKEPPRNCTANSPAVSGVKFPVITAEPPVIPVVANSAPTTGALTRASSRKIPILRPVPASFLVSSANFLPPSSSKLMATSQLLPWAGLGWAFFRFFPVKPMESKSSKIA